MVALTDMGSKLVKARRAYWSGGWAESLEGVSAEEHRRIRLQGGRNRHVLGGKSDPATSASARGGIGRGLSLR
jgi:hypothetical protein